MNAPPMLKTSLIYGTVAGALTIGVAILSLGLTGGESTHLASLEWLGYLTMILALSAIFVGVKRFRDNEQGGVISFGRAFAVGLGIAATAGVVYVAVWEISLAATDHAFIAEYTASMFAAKESAGASADELAAFAVEMEDMRVWYANPLFRIPMTFAEIFPVGLVISLIAAGVLRTKGGASRKSSARVPATSAS